MILLWFSRSFKDTFFFESPFFLLNISRSLRLEILEDKLTLLMFLLAEKVNSKNTFSSVEEARDTAKVSVLGFSVHVDLNFIESERNDIEGNEVVFV